MVLRFLSRTPRRDLSPREDSPPADFLPRTSQGGSNNGAKADIGRKTKEEVAHLLSRLEKEGVEIDDKIASIVDDGIARIKAEAVRENINEPKKDGKVLLRTIGFIAIGFMMGAEWYEHVFFAPNAEEKRVRDEKLAKSSRPSLNSLGLAGPLFLWSAKRSRQSW